MSVKSDFKKAKAPTDQDPVINLHGYLECPICFEFAVSPIYTCNNGHIVCGICHENMQRCPTCRAENLIVNDFVERVLKAEGVVIPCRNTLLGCTSKIQPSAMIYHLKNFCDFRPIQCTEIDRCDNKSHIPSELLQHWIDIHHIDKEVPDLSKNEINSIGTIHLSWSLKEEVYNRSMNSLARNLMWPPRYFEIEGRIFIVHVRAEEETIHTWITLLGEESDARNFEYTTTISSKLCKSKKRQLMVVDVPVHSIQFYDFEKICNCEHTVPIHYCTLKMFQDNKPKDPLNIFEWDVRIDISKKVNEAVNSSYLELETWEGSEILLPLSP